MEGDPTSIHLAANALVSLQKLYGRIPKANGIGTVAQKVWQLTKSLGRDEPVIVNSGKGSIDQLILIDRSIDLMSVLATQLTYEGLIGKAYQHRLLSFIVITSRHFSLLFRRILRNQSSHRPLPRRTIHTLRRWCRPVNVIARQKIHHSELRRGTLHRIA